MLSMEPWAAAKKKLLVCVAVPPAPVLVPSQRPLSLSVKSISSVANDKGDNEMVPGAVHRSPGICLTAEENSGKPQAGDLLMKGCADKHRLKWGPFPLNEVGMFAQHVRKGEGRIQIQKLRLVSTHARSRLN